MKELKEVARVAKENERQRLEFMSLHEEFEKCKGCMGLFVIEEGGGKCARCSG